MTTTTTTTATATMTTEAAEAVTTEIREAGKALVANRTKFAAAVKRAKDGQAHVGMGLPSWSEYVATVFADMPGLGKADTEYLTAFMAGEGMSSRAVARVLGVSQSTANRLIAKAEAKGEVSADRKVEGTDGKAQAKGKGKGRPKGSAGRTASEKKAEAVSQGDSPVTERVTSVKQAKTDELRALALSILAELSDRWAEGDEAAEAAVLEVADAAMVTA
jgi:transposase